MNIALGIQKGNKMPMFNNKLYCGKVYPINLSNEKDLEDITSEYSYYYKNESTWRAKRLVRKFINKIYSKNIDALILGMDPVDYYFYGLSFEYIDSGYKFDTRLSKIPTMSNKAKYSVVNKNGIVLDLDNLSFANRSILKNTKSIKKVIVSLNNTTDLFTLGCITKLMDFKYKRILITGLSEYTKLPVISKLYKEE